MSVASWRGHKFTGKERDSESGLDNFGARYYGSNTGRFMSPDEPFADQWEHNPQSWNLYTYGRNNPLRNLDPTGNECVTIKGGEGKDVVGDDGQGSACDHMTEGSGQADATVDGKPPTAIETAVDNTAWFLNYAGEQIFGTWLGAFDQATRTKDPVVGTLALASMIVPLKGGSASQEIKITARGLAHVTGRHLINTAKKSAFNLGEDVVALVRGAESTGALQQAGGNFARIVDAGRPIGMDRATGQLTSIYTVITNAAGELVTAFPGKP